MHKSRENTIYIAVDWVDVLDHVLDVVTQPPAVSQRARTILERRFGLNSGYVETLAAIGHDLSLTRERVRQIASKSLKRIRQVRNQIPGLSDLSQAIELALVTYEGVVPKSEILSGLCENADSSISYDLSMAISFLINVGGWEVQTPKSNRDDWMVFNSSTTGAQIRSAIKSAISKLKGCGPLPSDFLMESIASELGLPERVVNRAISITDQVRLDTNGIATPQKLFQWQKVAYVLRRLGSPTHFTGIAAAVRDQFSDLGHVSDHSVLVILGDHKPGVFRRVAPGTYGLADWRLTAASDSANLAA
jgi:hypothetical protein